MCALRASCPRQAHASKIVTDADNRSHMRAWPAPYAYYTLNKPTPAAQDEIYGLRRKILGLRSLPPRNFRNRTTKKSCAFNVTGVLQRDGRNRMSICFCLVETMCESKNGGGALSVTPVRACVRPLSKFVVRSITFERLHWFNSNLECWYIISKHRSSSIWVTIHYFVTELWAFYKNSTNIGVRSITCEKLHRFDSYLACWYIISKHRLSSI